MLGGVLHAMHTRADRGATGARERPQPSRTDPRGLSPAALLSLQRQAGNRAARRLARRVEIRGVPWEAESGISRLPELIARMNAISPSLTFSMDGDRLRYGQRGDPQPPNSFDLQMIDLIDRDDLGFQMLLLHFLTERAVTRNYAHRVGTNFPDVEFRHSHAQGVEAEAQVLREFFGDPSIVIWEDSPSPTVRRVFFSRRRHDKFRRRIRLGHGADQGVNASTVDVVTRQGQVLTPDAYLDLLRAEH